MTKKFPAMLLFCFSMACADENTVKRTSIDSKEPSISHKSLNLDGDSGAIGGFSLTLSTRHCATTTGIETYELPEITYEYGFSTDPAEGYAGAGGDTACASNAYLCTKASGYFREGTTRETIRRFTNSFKGGSSHVKYSCWEIRTKEETLDVHVC